LRKFLREFFLANVRHEHFESSCVGNLGSFKKKSECNVVSGAACGND
jgi:hypothetical protein